MIRTLTIAVVLVLAPVTLLPQEIHTVETQNEHMRRTGWELYPRVDTLTTDNVGRKWSKVRYAPLNTRLRIHWLDSVPVVRYALKDISGFHRYESDGAIWPLVYCDTTSWRMTACSLSVVKEGK